MGIKAMSSGLVDIEVFDSKGSVTDDASLYSVVGTKGIFFKNSKGFDGLSGAVVQITINFPTLGDMLGNLDVLEINQKRNAKGNVTPARDTFFMRSPAMSSTLKTWANN